MAVTDWTLIPPGTRVREPIHGNVLLLKEVVLRDGAAHLLRAIDPANRSSHCLDPAKAELVIPEADDKVSWKRAAPGRYHSKQLVRGAPAAITAQASGGWLLEVSGLDDAHFTTKREAQEAVQKLVTS